MTTFSMDALRILLVVNLFARKEVKKDRDMARKENTKKKSTFGKKGASTLLNTADSFPNTGGNAVSSITLSAFLLWLCL